MADKRQKWIITSAWPYVNATPHLGNMVGSVLSADVFARYLRLKGDDVVFVSGSDEHGTPTAVSAIKEGVDVKTLTDRNHAKIADLFKRWKISYDNYTRTHNPIHIKFTQQFYLTAQRNGYIFTKEEEILFCPKCDLPLPDRFVVGTCPYCHAPGARGDQCDNPKCGKLLTPLELLEPQCSICGTTPERRVTTNWYFDLPKFQDRLKALIEANSVIPDNARTMCLNAIKKGLPARAITRDLKWGIPAPFEGAEGKTIYVWFEAVLGYISATIQWAEEIVGEPGRWRDFWFDQSTKAVYFIGKDNIIFHLLLLPAFLLAVNENAPPEERYVLPYNVSSTEFLMYEHDKFSKSRGVGIWIDDALELLPVDYWRYSLIRNRPETRDQSFLWSEFQKNVNELNDIFGNFIHRVLTFLKRNFGGKVPDRLDLDERDAELLKAVEEAPSRIGSLVESFQFKAAIEAILDLARAGNQYLSDKAPWHLIKDDERASGHVLNLSIQVVHALAILLVPFTPTSARKIWNMLNLRSDVFKASWDSAGTSPIEAGHAIGKPKPLFHKVDVGELQEKLAHLHGSGAVGKAPDARGGARDSAGASERAGKVVPFKTFQKFDFRTAVVADAERVPDAKKLLKLTLDLGGGGTRVVVAGIGDTYNPSDLEGKNVVVLANLEPRKVHGIQSEGMVLAVEGENGESALLTCPGEVAAGSKIR
ncbi:MAG: methionine--tRNA ligase [Promethearchaeota archaeon]